MFPLSPEISLQLTNQRMAEDRETARRRRLAREVRRAQQRQRRVPPGRPDLAVAHPSHRPAMLAFLQGLSSRTVYRRFFTPRVRWSERDLDRLLPDDDHGEAVVALWQEQVVAHAMLAPGPDERALDLAVVVADDWQGLGLGSRVVDELLAGDPAAGAGELQFTVQGENGLVLRQARRRWPDATSTVDGSLVHFRVPRSRTSPSDQG